MTARVDFYFDVVSPASYLAWARLPAIAERTGAEIDWKPIFLPGLFQLAGVKPAVTLPVKRSYMAKDFLRCAARDGVPMSMNPHFPMNTLPIQRALIGWRHTPLFDQLLDIVFPAVWRDEVNVANSAKLDETLESGGISADGFWAAANDPVNKDLLKANTEEAADRGAFGAPSMFVADELFFGQDRLDFVEAALKAA